MGKFGCDDLLAPKVGTELVGLDAKFDERIGTTNRIEGLGIAHEHTVT